MSEFVTNLDLYVALKSGGGFKNIDFLFNVLIERIGVELSSEDLSTIKSFCRNFSSNISKRWSASSRAQKTFLHKNSEWLESQIAWPKCQNIDLNSIFKFTEEDILTEEEAIDTQVDTPSSSCGTSKKPFLDLSDKQKKRRSLTLLDHTEEELVYALCAKLKESKKTKLAAIINELCQNEEKCEIVHRTLFAVKTVNPVLPDNKALALLTSTNLSKWQYRNLRSILASENIFCLPSYQKLLNAKKTCYPPETDITVTESYARIRLQSLLDLTTNRILKIIQHSSTDKKSLKLISKWGFDGSSSQSNYKQKSQSSTVIDDSSVFMISLVPLRLEEESGTVLWKNPAPSSTNYCRPIGFTFAKETNDLIKKESASLEEEIGNLVATIVDNLNIRHVLYMTMIDGKISTVISNTSSAAVCNICNTPPSKMNDLDFVSNKPVREEMYKYGLSSLHMWIRCMECILHISYNLDFKKWAARNEDKLLKETKKNMTQEEFRERTGLLIDIVKQGFGTTNDGNTARRFFENYEVSAEITGINPDLIKRFAVILQTISSGQPINTNLFREYCRETAVLYVKLYPWYYMPSSVHKLLIHGADICDSFSFIPIGMLSEEASEARNKDFRNVRMAHTRKIGRLQTNLDILHNFLISSDPYISHIKPKFTRLHKQLFPEANALILNSDSLPLESEEIEIPQENIDPNIHH